MAQQVLVLMTLFVSYSVEMVSVVFSLLLARFVTDIGEMRNEYEIFDRRPRKIPLRKHIFTQ